jgi:hypothetical protein
MSGLYLYANGSIHLYNEESDWGNSGGISQSESGGNGVSEPDETESFGNLIAPK